MKILFSILFILLLAVLSVSAQDKVYTKNGKVIEVNAVEQTYSVLKYQMADYPDGPLFWMPMNKVEKIEYKNGTVDYLENLSPRIKKPFCLSINASLFLEGEGLLPALKAGYFMTPQLEFEGFMSTDFEGSIALAVGPKFHLCQSSSNQRITPFAGFMIGTDYGIPMTLIPIGLNYASEKGLNISMSLDIMNYWDTESWMTNLFTVGVGWRF
jgi:hypothetical protein